MAFIIFLAISIQPHYLRFKYYKSLRVRENLSFFFTSRIAGIIKIKVDTKVSFSPNYPVTKLGHWYVLTYLYELKTCANFSTKNSLTTFMRIMWCSYSWLFLNWGNRTGKKFDTLTKSLSNYLRRMKRLINVPVTETQIAFIRSRQSLM